MCDGKAYDIKSDVWSFGCIVYEVCALERLFEGTVSRFACRGAYYLGTST